MVEVRVPSGQLSGQLDVMEVFFEGKGGPIKSITPMSDDRATIEFEGHEGTKMDSPNFLQFFSFCHRFKSFTVYF